MSKTIRNKFDECLTYEKLYEAYKRAANGKTLRKEIVCYEMNLENNLFNTYEKLKNGTYEFGKYREFTIHDPKERVVRTLPFKDRVVHQWYVEEFIKPFYLNRFVYDNYACLDDKGALKSSIKMQKMMKRMHKKNKDYYVLKCDVKKFFYNINKDVLLEILKKRIKDKKIIDLTKKILDDEIPVGVAIGNLTSQYFANIYLNELDYYIKFDLRIKNYSRYMDDFVMLLDSKKECKRVLKLVNEFVESKLKLKLNHKSRYYPNKFGVNYCGYIIYQDYLLLRKRFKKDYQKRLKLWKKLNNLNKLDYQKYSQSYASIIGHTKHCDSYKYLKKYEPLVLDINKKFILKNYECLNNFWKYTILIQDDMINIKDFRGNEILNTKLMEYETIKKIIDKYKIKKYIMFMNNTDNNYLIIDDLLKTNNKVIYNNIIKRNELGILYYYNLYQ